MFKMRTIGASAIVLAAALTLTSVTPGFAAQRHHATAPAAANASQPRYYNYVPGAEYQGLSRFHGGPGQYGPPDPASCGGFAC